MQITITGYDQVEYCEHCGRRLVHGIRTNTHGTIGADCFIKMIKADKKRFSGNGKPTTTIVREYALRKERLSEAALKDRGYYPQHFVFDLV